MTTGQGGEAAKHRCIKVLAREGAVWTYHVDPCTCSVKHFAAMRETGERPGGAGDGVVDFPDLSDVERFDRDLFRSSDGEFCMFSDLASIHRQRDQARAVLGRVRGWIRTCCVGHPHGADELDALAEEVETVLKVRP